MSKDITEDILLKAGFKKISEISYCTTYVINNIAVTHFIYSKPTIRSWECRVTYNNYFTSAYIQTIDHFNKLMDLMGIDFRLKEK